MQSYRRTTRQIVILALRYAIPHIAGDIESEEASQFPDHARIDQLRSQHADFQAMHHNLTGEYFSG